MAPVPDSRGEVRGVVAEGAVGTRWAGRLRVSDDPAVAERILERLPGVPPPISSRARQSGYGSLMQNRRLALVLAPIFAMTGFSALVLQVVEGQTGSLQDVAQTTMANAGFRRVQGARSAINGLDAYVGTYDGQIEGLGQVTTRAAHIAHAGKVYLVAGLCPPPAFDKADPLFSTAIRSFRALSAADAEGIRPSRIDLYVVRGGDTWAALAERSGGAVTPAALSIMNGAAPTSSPEVGRRIKIVVAG